MAVFGSNRAGQCRPALMSDLVRPGQATPSHVAQKVVQHVSQNLDQNAVCEDGQHLPHPADLNHVPCPRYQRKMDRPEGPVHFPFHGEAPGFGRSEARAPVPAT